MAGPGTIAVRKELESICSTLFADEERIKTHDCLKQKWALKKARANNPFDGPLLQLVVETKMKQRTVFGPIVKARVNEAESKKPSKTKKMYYEFLVISEQSFAIILVLEEYFSLAVLGNYPSDPIGEDLKSRGTVLSGKKVILDGRWLTAKLDSMEVVLLEKVQGLCRELYKEPETVKPFKISLRGNGSSLQSGSSAKKSKGKRIAQEAERPLPVPTEREQSTTWSNPASSPPQRQEGSSAPRSKPSFLPSGREEASSPTQSVGRRSVASSLVQLETVSVRL
jgi:hypothetical protein